MPETVLTAKTSKVPLRYYNMEKGMDKNLENSRNVTKIGRSLL